MQTQPTFVPKKFRQSYLKLERAKKHLKELNHELELFSERTPIRLVWESVPWDTRLSKIYDEEFDIVGLVVRTDEIIPDNIAPIIGDIVHNLRSALDVMMFDIVKTACPSVNENAIAFPMSSKESGLNTQIKKRSINKVEEKHQSLIKAWEPYPNGKFNIYALHELNNIDKHRTIIPTIAGVEYSQTQAFFGNNFEYYGQ